MALVHGLRGAEAAHVFRRRLSLRLRLQRPILRRRRIALGDSVASQRGTQTRVSVDEGTGRAVRRDVSGQRRRRLEALGGVPGTLVLYESPFRVVKLLQELADLYPDRRVALARELTKKFEEVRSGSPRQLLEELQKRSIHGEFVVLVGSKGL